MLKTDKCVLQVFSLLCLLILSINITNAQQKTIDSLNTVLKGGKLTPIENLQAMILLTKCYIDEEKDKAHELCDKTLALARNQNNIELKLQAYVNKAFTQEMRDSIESSYYLIDTCFQYMEKVGNTRVKAEALMGIAGLKHGFQDESDVLSIVLNALDMAKQIDDKKLQVRIYYFLTNVYYAQLKDTENISKYAELASQATDGLSDKQAQGLSYISKGFMYRMKFVENREHPAYLDSSIVYMNKSISLFESIDGLLPLKIQLNPVGHLTSSYTYKTFERNDSTFYIYPDSIYKYAHIMLNKAQKAHNPYYTATAYNFLSGYESNYKRFQKAEEMLLKAMDILNDSNDRNLQKRHSISLSLVYQLRIMGKYEQALDYLEDAYICQEKLYRKKYIRDGQITEAKYRLKEKERQLLLSQEKAKEQRRFLLGSIFGGAILILFLFIFYQMRLKNSTQKNKLLEKEKEEVRLKSIINEKELQRSESQRKTLALEKELEKEKAERQALEINQLQKELIVGSAQLEQKNETIEKIKQKLNENKQLNDNDIKNLFLSDKMADKSFDSFFNLLQKVHPGFYSKLQEKADQKLTVLHLKYCTYIFMNFSSKEIANITHVSSNTVRTTKYRLKRKLNLAKEENLATYIKNVIQ